MTKNQWKFVEFASAKISLPWKMKNTTLICEFYFNYNCPLKFGRRKLGNGDFLVCKCKYLNNNIVKHHKYFNNFRNKYFYKYLWNVKWIYFLDKWITTSKEVFTINAARSSMRIGVVEFTPINIRLAGKITF